MQCYNSLKQSLQDTEVLERFHRGLTKSSRDPPSTYNTSCSLYQSLWVHEGRHGDWTCYDELTIWLWPVFFRTCQSCLQIFFILCPIPFNHLQSCMQCDQYNDFEIENWRCATWHYFIQFRWTKLSITK